MILEVFSTEMQSMGINYSFMQAEKAAYPYFTGEYRETDYSCEDAHTEGELIVEGWTRNSYGELLTIKDKIKEHFADFRTLQDGFAVSINYDTAYPILTGEAELKKIQIILSTKEFKGAN